MSQLEDIAARALETAKKLGAQHASSYAARAQNLNIAWRKGKIETMLSAGESGLSIDLYVDGRYGHYSTSDMRPETIDALIQKGIDMTRLLEEDPARTLPDPERYKNRSAEDLDLYDQTVADMTPNQLIERCKELETVCQSHTELPIGDITVEYNMQTAESFKASTNGFSGGRRGSMLTGAVAISMNDGEKKPSDYAYFRTRHLADASPAEKLAQEAAYFGALKLQQKKLPSKNRTVIFDRRVTGRVISSYLSPLYGMSLVNKKSYFEGRIDQTVASNLFDLHDDPFIKRGLGSALFDSEGVSVHPSVLFDHGVLKMYLLNTYTANKLNLKPMLSAPTNLILTPGKRTVEEMIADVDDGIYIFDLLGGNKDEVRGDFSHGIVGAAIEKGRLTDHVSEMNITGNHLELWKNLTEVGCDPRHDSTMRTPSLRFENVSISGI